MVETLLQELIPAMDVQSIVVYFVLMIFIYPAKMVFEFIRMKWEHIVSVRRSMT
jgi:hypothetical protein